MIDQINQFIGYTLQFIGYVFAFWLLWRFFDGLIHYRSNRKKPEVPHCRHCVEYEKQIKNLQQQIRRAEGQLRDKQKLDTIAEEAIALGQLNVASLTEIKEIYGIGMVKAAKIITHRPYFSWDHFNGIEGSSKSSILCWAKKRIGLNR